MANEFELKKKKMAGRKWQQQFTYFYLLNVSLSQHGIVPKYFIRLKGAFSKIIGTYRKRVIGTLNKLVSSFVDSK